MKFKHITCKENLHKNRLRVIKYVITSRFALYILMLICSYLIAFILFCINPLLDFNWFSFLLTCGAWSVFYSDSQEIIDLNQFTLYNILGFLIIILSGIMIVITKSSYLNFVITGYPLFFICYFRLLLFLFYKDFIRSYKKPTILFARKFGKWTHENADPSYIPTKKEIIFSNLLFFGPFAIALLVFYLVNLL